MNSDSGLIFVIFYCVVFFVGIFCTIMSMIFDKETVATTYVVKQVDEPVIKPPEDEDAGVIIYDE